MTERVTITNEGGLKKVTTTTAGSKEGLDVTLLDSDGNDAGEEIIAQLEAINSLIPTKWDSFTGTYDVSNNLTIAVFKLSTTVISTITLSYDENNNLTNAVKT